MCYFSHEKQKRPTTVAVVVAATVDVAVAVIVAVVVAIAVADRNCKMRIVKMKVIAGNLDAAATREATLLDGRFSTSFPHSSPIAFPHFIFTTAKTKIN